MYLLAYRDENVNEDEKNFFFKGCHVIILTIENLKRFFPEKCPMGKLNQKYLIWSWANPSENVVLSKSVESACLHEGLWELQLCLPGHAMISVLLPSHGVSLHCLDGRLQGLQEDMVQPGLRAALRNWETHTTISMGHGSGLRWTIHVSELWNISLWNVRIYWKVLFSVKNCFSSLISKWLFWRVSFSDKKQCFALRRVVFRIRKCMKRNIPQKINLSGKTSKQSTLSCPFADSHFDCTWGIPKIESLFMVSAAEWSARM